jgi:hypothetical protein
MDLARTTFALALAATGIVLVSAGSGCVTDVDKCPEYCRKITEKCGGLADTAQFIDDGACRAMCTTISENAKAGSVGTDTVECRLGQISNVDEAPPDSGTDTRASRCMQAGAYSAACAGNVCTAWCRIVQSVCTGTNAQYPSQAQCEAACNTFPAGAVGNILGGKVGNTLTCRLYHLEAASSLNGASLHCPHLAANKLPPCQ